MSGFDHDFIDSFAPWGPRLLAGLLALGGLFWGLLLSPWQFQSWASPVFWAVFGPGYLITLGYIIRAVCTPPMIFRRLIWIGSLLVQGAWLLWLIWCVIEEVAAGNSARNEANLATAWWVFATAASVAGLFTERTKQAEPGAADEKQGESGGELRDASHSP